MVSGNLFAQLPADLSQEVFETLAERSGVRIERIVSKGHTSPETGWYDQDQHEWVAVLQGNAELSFADGQSIALGTGDYVLIEPHEKHKVTGTSSRPETIWLAVHY